MSDFGELDHSIKCFMFIPPSLRFVLIKKIIAKVENVKIAVKGSGRNFLSHTASFPGGEILQLREFTDGYDCSPSHFPMEFHCPSIVTLSVEDIKEIAIDVKCPTDSVNWPGMEILLACPVCRNQAIPDVKSK